VRWRAVSRRNRKRISRQAISRTLIAIVMVAIVWIRSGPTNPPTASQDSSHIRQDDARARHISLMVVEPAAGRAAIAAFGHPVADVHDVIHEADLDRLDRRTQLAPPDNAATNARWPVRGLGLVDQASFGVGSNTVVAVFPVKRRPNGAAKVEIRLRTPAR
jgi:hypothetical protein